MAFAERPIKLVRHILCIGITALLLKNCSKLLVVKVVQAESAMSAVYSTVFPPSLIVFISNVSKAS